MRVETWMSHGEGALVGGDKGAQTLMKLMDDRLSSSALSTCNVLLTISLPTLILRYLFLQFVEQITTHRCPLLYRGITHRNA